LDLFLKLKVFSMSKNRKILVLVILSLLLPIIISSITYLVAVLLLNTNNDATYTKYFELIQSVFSSSENWITAILQSYYVYVFPFLMALIFLVQSNENVNSRVQKYNDIAFGKYIVLIKELALFLLSAIIMLAINLLTAYGCYAIFAHMIRSNHFVYDISIPADYSFIAIFKPFSEIVIGIIIVCLVYYLFIDLLIILTKSIYVPTFIIVLLHVVQLTPYIFVSTYFTFLSNTLYSQNWSLFFYFPSRYISRDSMNLSPESSLLVLSGYLAVLLCASFLCRKFAFNR